MTAQQIYAVADFETYMEVISYKCSMATSYNLLFKNEVSFGSEWGRFALLPISMLFVC